MRFRATIALTVFAFAMAAFAQRGGGHAGAAGSIGGRGSAAGRAGFSGSSGFSGSGGFSRTGSFARPAPPVRYGGLGNREFRGYAALNSPRLRVPYSGNRYMTGRPAYGWPRAESPRSLDRNGDHSGNRGGDRDRWDARRRSFQNWYANFPTWPGYGYPYLIDPGFYDWGDSDDTADEGSGAIPETLSQYPDNGYGPADEGPQQGYPEELPPWNPQVQQPAAPSGSASLAPEQPLTVIFKSGRAPVKMQNYMMTAKVITDLDSRPYQEIPIDEIDISATRRVNIAAGVGFEIPGASRD